MMFVDAESDGILIRDVFGPQVYCRTCGHYTYPVEGNRCAWCKSTAIGGSPALVRHVRFMSAIKDSEPLRTKHQRLKEGFSMLRSAEFEGRAE